MAGCLVQVEFVILLLKRSQLQYRIVLFHYELAQKDVDYNILAEAAMCKIVE